MAENTRYFQVGKSVQGTQPTSEFTASHAVVIGINDYTNGIPRLSTATNDARRLAEILHNDHAYAVELLVEGVTRARLVDLFTQTLPQQVSKDDRLLVYFAGHGIALDGEDGPAGYLIPQDAKREESSTFLAMTELHGWLSALPCRHLLAIMDCCFAGAFRWASTRDVQPLPTTIYRERYERFIRDPAWQVITSAAYDQKALDFLKGDSLGARGAQGAHSPFAAALFQALAGAGDLVPKDGGDGVITAAELYLYLRDEVEVSAQATANHRQTPGLWPLKKHDKGEFIFLTPGKAINLPSAPELTTANNPYRGLASYNYNDKDARLFFGRTRLINELTIIVDQQPLTVVLGASGTGKSSLVKAGLLPKLRPPAKRKENNGSLWHILSPIRPTERPLSALNNLLNKELCADGGLLNTDGRRSDEDNISLDLQTIVPSVLQIVASWCATHPNQHLLLVIDQLEELITLCLDDQERLLFLDLLAQLLRAHADHLRLVFTLRSDFEPQFADSSLFAQHGSDVTRFIVPPLSQAELRQVIEGPAAANTLFFEDGKLVDDLLNEVVQTPGALPLLSFTLEQLYLKYLKRQEEARKHGETIDRVLTRADYVVLGGVIGSLRTRADEEYNQLPDDAHRATMQRVMLRMVAVEGNEVARRRVLLTELVYPFNEENARVQTILNRLVDARLLVKGSTDVNRDRVSDPIVEPAHDALVAAWDRLSLWKRQAEEELLLQRRLWQAASEWRQAAAGRKTALLWDDNPRLPQVEDLLWPTPSKQNDLLGWVTGLKQILWPNVALSANTRWLNQVEVEFVQASVARRASGLRRIIAITAAVIVTLAGLTLYARLQANNAQLSARAEAAAAADARDKQAQAERTARRARAGELAAYAQTELISPLPDISLALLLARIAVSTTLVTDGYSTPGASSSLVTAIDRAQYWRQTLPRHRHLATINTGALSPDGQRLLTASEDATVRVWDVVTGRELLLLTGHDNRVNAAVFSSDGRHIASASRDKTIRIWDAISGQEMLRLEGHLDGVKTVAYSPDATQLVSAALDGTSRIWDAASGRELLVLQGHEGIVNSAAYSPDGQYIVTTGLDQTIRIWDAHDGSKLLQLKGHGSSVNMAAYSPDGASIVSASADGSARIWDASSGEERLQLRGHEGDVWAVAYSPDGAHIVTAGADVTVRVWNAQTGAEVNQLQGHREQILSVTYSVDGGQIVTAGSDWTARIWDAQTGRQMLQVAGHAADVSSAAFSPDGKWVVTASNDGTAWLWNAASGEVLLQLDIPGDRVESAAFSPNGKRIVTAGDDGTARVWDATSGEELLQLAGDTETLLAVAYSLDGRRIATAGYAGMAYIWDAANGEQLLSLEGHSEAIAAIAFSKDGKRVVTASDDRTVRVWDGNYGDELLVLVGHTSPVLAACRRR